MDTSFPFSTAFGIADTRENCVVSAQKVYERLLLGSSSSDGILPFETIAKLGLQRNGELDYAKVMDLIRVLRPDGEGRLTLIDFVRSVDAVYKELKLLRATVTNSMKIDQALGKVLNAIFYAVLTVIVLSRAGYDPKKLFLSVSGIILTFSFMIRSASAAYFDVSLDERLQS